LGVIATKQKKKSTMELATDKPLEMETSASSSIEDRVYLERVRLFFGHAVGNSIAAMIGALLIGVVLNGAQVPVNDIVIWLTVVSIFISIVAVIEHRFSNSVLTIENAKKWVFARIIAGSAVGILYGISPFLFSANVAPAQEMFLFIILSAMISIASTGYSIMPYHYISLNAVTMVPLTIFFATKSDSLHLVLVVTAVIWQVFVLAKAWKVSKTSIGAIYLNERLRDEIEEHKSTKDQLRHLATHDGLTGLPNRILLMDRLEVTARWGHRYKKRFAVMFMDLDGFKAVNDIHGHDAGDVLLKGVASRLVEQTRETDMVARLGGDEFIIVYTGIGDGTEEVTRLAKRLLDSLSEPVPLSDNTSGQVTGSIGIAVFPDQGTEVEELVKAADRAMYGIKAKGKNNFAYA